MCGHDRSCCDLVGLAGAPSGGGNQWESDGFAAGADAHSPGRGDGVDDGDAAAVFVADGGVEKTGEVGVVVGDFTGEDARGHADADVNNGVGVEDGVVTISLMMS